MYYDNKDKLSAPSELQAPSHVQNIIKIPNLIPKRTMKTVLKKPQHIKTNIGQDFISSICSEKTWNSSAHRCHSKNPPSHGPMYLKYDIVVYSMQRSAETHIMAHQYLYSSSSSSKASITNLPISSISKAFKSRKGLLLPNNSNTGSSFPLTRTMKLPLPGFSLLISTLASQSFSARYLAILFARVLNTDH